MGASSEDAYSYPFLAWLLHSLPHLNVTFHQVNSSFEPHNPVYLESLGILGSIPAAWLILTLLVLLIYLLTRSIGLGLYGNDDLHNGLERTLNEGKKVDTQVSTIRNQSDAIERQLRIQASGQLNNIQNIIEAPTANVTMFNLADTYLKRLIGNNTMAANAAKDIRQPLMGLDLTPKILLAEKIENIRWPLTMAILSILLILCVILLVGVARHNRCALIAFSVCGLLAVIASYLMASVYLASSVALADLYRFIHSLTALVDCRSLHMNYLEGSRALCNVGLLGLTLMLISAVLAGLLLTALVWVDSHTWIYIRKKKDYHQVNENDPYLPPPQASQAIAARTLQRSQGSSYPPDTPPPSYSSALMRPNACLGSTPHEADLLLY
ncbi:hypothetical protein NQ317_007154 [Molorchus minor]|uniref:Protein tweety homolog n=1 Tax=Molorchus minor TaxID=1323400 RepID=A0ABQ9J611_9CUCU|nr:hypothetical protein NQ317_007154 [Molorchus minor]